MGDLFGGDDETCNGSIINYKKNLMDSEQM